jgi:hypothetical protein
MSEEKKRVTASHTSTGHKAYHVEVRSVLKERTVQLMGRYYGSEWVRWTPDSTCLPVSRLYAIERYHHLFTYEEAMAMAWMALAHSRGMIEKDGHGLEVRLVESVTNHSFHAEVSLELEPLPWRCPEPEKEKAS